MGLVDQSVAREVAVASVFLDQLLTLLGDEQAGIVVVAGILQNNAFSPTAVRRGDQERISAYVDLFLVSVQRGVVIDQAGGKGDPGVDEGGFGIGEVGGQLARASL